MGSVWKRLNRINKRAAKFKFTASYSELWLEAGPNWQPTALSVIWTRKSRREVSAPVQWEPTMKSPYIGMCVWPVPENKTITVTMFRDPHKEEYDNKDWFFILEDVNSSGKRKPVAQGRLNMREFCSTVPTQSELTVKLRPISKKVTAAKLSLTLTSELIREGKASDSDMISQLSYGSTSTMNEDWKGRLKEVGEEEEAPETGSARQELSSLTRQIEQFGKEKEQDLRRPLKAQPPEKPRPGRDENENREPRRGASSSHPTENRASQSLAERLLKPHSPREKTSEASLPRLCEKTSEASMPSLSEKHPETSEPSPAQVPPVKPRELDTRPRIIDEKVKGETSSRGFGSREFKSVYNGPRGNYDKGRTVVSPLKESLETSPKEKATPISELEVLAKCPPPLQPRSLPPISPRTPAPSPHFKTSPSPPIAPVQAPNQTIAPSPLPHVPAPIATPVPFMAPTLAPAVSTPIATPSPPISPAKDPSPIKELSPVNASSNGLALEGVVIPEEPPVKKISLVSDDDEPEEEDARKYSRTKSQEFRDYQADFVLSSTIDFGPLSSPVPVRKAVASPTKSVSPSTRSSSPPPQTKTEIAPSSSFLDNLNRVSTVDQSSTSTTASTSPTDLAPRPFERGSGATATMARREKVLTDRTNSLLRQNTTSASEELLEWTKSVLAPYSNVKVTNFNSSWRNGLAFCAIIHSFYPDLIPYSRLTPHEVKENCKLAFEAGERLGVSRLIEPADMVIKRVPDKLLVITYLHQLRSCMGKEETRQLYEQSKAESTLASTGVRKSFSEGNIRMFSRGSSNDTESGLETIQESPVISDMKPEKISEYRKRAQTLVKLARSESRELSEQEDTENGEKEKENEHESTSPPRVLMRQKSSTPKPRRDNRLSYIDNEIKVLDAEQIEIDKQAAILEKRLRETSEDDQLVYDALLQQFLTLVNKKNALMKRQFQLNMLEKEEDLEKKLFMLQEELRALSELEDHRKTEEDRRREDLLLEELVACVKKRNELVMQQDEEEKQIEVDEALDQEVTAAENEHLRNNKKEDCRMQ